MHTVIPDRVVKRVSTGGCSFRTELPTCKQILQTAFPGSCCSAPTEIHLTGKIWQSDNRSFAFVFK